MSEYTAAIEVAVGPERAFAVFTDATRFPQWQAAALRVFDQTGPLTEQGAAVRIDHGPRMIRQMTVIESDPPRRLRYRQQGMGFDDVTEALFEDVGGRTRITLTTSLRVAGGAIGRVFERLSMGQNRQEFRAELERFGSVVHRPRPTPHVPGALLTAESGAGLRMIKVLAHDEDAVHVAVLPGIASNRQADPVPFLDRESPLIDPLNLQPLPVPIRRLASRIVPGQPALRLDGALGVPHVALSPDAFVDAMPEATGRTIEVWDHERSEVASWRGAQGPVLGRDVDAGLTTLMTVKAGDEYAPAKLLHADRHGVHVRLYADRWKIPPDDIDPWRLGLGTSDSGDRGVGHMPMTRRAFLASEPAFDRLVMIGPDELVGYRSWLESGGGYFG